MDKIRSFIWAVFVSSAFDHALCATNGCFCAQMKYMDDYIPLESELWQVTMSSQNSIACGYLCKNDGSCVAFSFNTLSYTCRGYSTITDVLTGATSEEGSIYYLMDCRSFKGLTVAENAQVQANTSLPFSKDVTWYGNGATLEPGKFICRISGVYKVNLHALSLSEIYSAWINVYRNSELLVSVRGDDHCNVGNIVIVTLHRGDQIEVLVRPDDVTPVALYGEVANQMTSFSTVLVRGDHEGGAVHAFSVALTHYATLVAGEHVKYDMVITDTASLYDDNSGTVIVKERGLYVLHFFAVAQYDTEVFLGLYLNENLVVSLQSYSGQNRAAAGNTAIVRLATGDQLSVRTSEDNNALLGENDEIYTTFSGSLIATELDIMKGGKQKCWDGTRSRSYSYTLAVSSSGKTCQAWTAQWPHGHSRTEDYRYPCDGSAAAAVNYCRDPDWEGFPWCYTMDPGLRWESCGVPLCDTLGKKWVVAFSVALSHPLDVPADTKVVFDHVILDLNCDYSTSSGDFVAPVAGLYEFNFAAAGGEESAILWLELWQNDRYIITAFGLRVGYKATGGNSALIDLEQGDSVYVKANSGQLNKLYSTSSELLCTFSGFLVYHTG